MFPGKGMKTRLTESKRVFINAKKDAGIESLRVHDLRHTYASIAVNNGASLYEVQKLPGHHSSAMTQRYAYLGDKQLKGCY